MNKYKDFLLFGILVVMTLLLNKFHWRYADVNIYSSSGVFTFVGMVQTKSSDGKDVYIPVYIKR